MQVPLLVQMWMVPDLRNYSSECRKRNAVGATVNVKYYLPLSSVSRLKQDEAPGEGLSVFCIATQTDWSWQTRGETCVSYCVLALNNIFVFPFHLLSHLWQTFLSVFERFSPLVLNKASFCSVNHNIYFIIFSIGTFISSSNDLMQTILQT